MASYTGTATAAHPQDDVWSYLADLRLIREWDPSVADARLVSGEPGKVGSRYELDVTFLGRTVTLAYETVVSEPPHRIVFAAETDALSVVDEALVLPLPEGSRATWNASLHLKGVRQVLELPLRAAFARLGGKAEQGLRERLSEPMLAAAPPGAHP
ncbi:MAG: SRPBCC family protein [Solirubrobacterales bacterium]|nr:SRPBCC family protein [Solirubrobacterales bacterium]